VEQVGRQRGVRRGYFSENGGTGRRPSANLKSDIQGRLNGGKRKTHSAENIKKEEGKGRNPRKKKTKRGHKT